MQKNEKTKEKNRQREKARLSIAMSHRTKIITLFACCITKKVTIVKKKQDDFTILSSCLFSIVLIETIM
jgi:hypothetical protein